MVVIQETLVIMSRILDSDFNFNFRFKNAVEVRPIQLSNSRFLFPIVHFLKRFKSRTGFLVIKDCQNFSPSTELERRLYSTGTDATFS